MKHRYSLIIVLLIGVSGLLFAQQPGDFRSSASGFWGDYTKWQRYNGSAWVAATLGQTPGQTTSVYIQSGHIITLTSARKVKDLHIAKGTSATNAINGRVQLASYTLELYGKLRTYYAARGTVPGTSTTTMANMLITSTGVSGKVVVKGSSDRTLVLSTEWSDGTYAAPPAGQQNFRMEIEADADVTITMNATIRAYSWNIVSGILDVATNAIVHADRNVANQGDVTVAVDAVIIANSTSSATSFIRRSNGKRGGTFTLNGLLKVMGTDTAIAMTTVNLNGTVEYAGSGAQNFLKSGGDSSVNPDTYNDVILWGSGTKTLADNTTFNGTLTLGETADLALSTFTRTYGASSTLVYNGSSPQTTTDNEWPASDGPVHVVINNPNGVLINSVKAIAGDLTLQDGNLDLGSYPLDVQGTTYIESGCYTGGSIFTDGYSDLVNNYLSIAAGDVNMTGFSGITAMATNLPAKINREWNISASFTGSKTLTLYWEHPDDQYYDWTNLGVVPSVYLGATEIAQIAYNVTDEPHYVTVALNTFDVKGIYRVGPAQDQPLPIGLSSFTAVLSAQNYVTLTWVTQSETGVSGYYIYRSDQNNWEAAVKISDIISSVNSPVQQAYQYTDREIVADGTYYYWLQVQDLDGSTTSQGPAPVYYSTIGGEPVVPGVPLVAGINTIYPNPLTPYSVISYTITKAADVKFQVFNFRGQLVNSFTDGFRANGTHNIGWNGKDTNGNQCPAGLYFIKMQAGKDSSIRKVVILK